MSFFLTSFDCVVQARKIDVHNCLRFGVSCYKFLNENNTLPVQGIQGKKDGRRIELNGLHPQNERR